MTSIPDQISRTGWGGRTIVFSGDLGRYGDPITPDPAAIPRADYLLVESTYGDRMHPVIHATDVLGDVYRPPCPHPVGEDRRDNAERHEQRPALPALEADMAGEHAKGDHRKLADQYRPGQRGDGLGQGAAVLGIHLAQLDRKSVV